MPRTHYVPAFDGLRTLSIAGVILFHVVSTRSVVLASIARRGWFGVDVFFVLSGFLITWILLEERNRTGVIRLRRFYIRRALRLQPAYFSALSSMLIARYIFDRQGFELMRHALPYYLTYTFNLSIAFAVITAPPFLLAWTLCIEEQFYLVWPWCLRHISSKTTVRATIAAVLAIGIYRSATYLLLNRGHWSTPSPVNCMRLLWSTDTHIDAILIGCGFAAAVQLAELHVWRDALAQSRWFPTLAVIASLIISWCVTGREWLYFTFGMTLAAASVGLVVVALFLQSGSWPARLLALKPLVFIGKLSYGIYLFHLLVWNVLSYVIGPNDGSLTRQAAVVAAVGALSIAVAWVHYKLIEERILQMRERSVTAYAAASGQRILARWRAGRGLQSPSI